MRASPRGAAGIALVACLVAAAAPCLAAAGELLLTREAVVDGTADEVWRLIATKRGMESWLVPHAEVDMRAGGLVRTNHDPEGRIGDPKTVTNRVLTLRPKRMFSIQVTEAPRDFPFAELLQGTWYEIFLDPLPHAQTRVRCVGHGFTSDPVGFTARAFVDRGSAWALDQLERTLLSRRAKPSGR